MVNFIMRKDNLFCLNKVSKMLYSTYINYCTYVLRYVGHDLGRKGNISDYHSNYNHAI
jgi:hypothetical protein